jgi:hypothetical protein
VVPAPEGLYVNRKTQLVFFEKLQRSDIKNLPGSAPPEQKRKNYR